MLSPAQGLEPAAHIRSRPGATLALAQDWLLSPVEFERQQILKAEGV